jgi:O-acetyl-ADP-ribose deacetylase (regulator of RNase III)
MIVNYDGDILTSSAEIICHQTNCSGIMGGGLALQIRNTYPQVFDIYKQYCKSHNPYSMAGNIQVIPISSTRYIANCFGQRNIGKAVTDYNALRMCFGLICFFCQKNNIHTIAVPYKMGCGLAGGDWSIVYSIIESYFKDNDSITCEIWKL